VSRDEEVVLVSETDDSIGVEKKSKVHTNNTPLHRAFSLFLFNDKGEILVQQRALSKQTWPGAWSNSCCGHPLPEESYEVAIARRVKEELGVDITSLEKVSDYRYQFERHGVVENEWCPVYRAQVVGEIKPNPDEVGAFEWKNWEEWKDELKQDAAGDRGKWSEWCKEEVVLFNQ